MMFTQRHLRLFSLLSLVISHGSFTGCSTYRTYDSLQVGRDGHDQTEGRSGQPYYLPKTLVRLTIKAAGDDSGGGKKDSGAAGGTSNTGGAVTVNVYNNGTTTTGGDPPKNEKPKEKPGEPKSPKVEEPDLSGVVVGQGGGSSTTPKPDGLSSKPQDSTGTPGTPDKISPGSIKYAITVSTETVPDYDSGVLYLQQTSNWFYSEETKIAINDKNLLATSESTSSDRTAQVIYNLADAALNIVKAGTAYAAGEVRVISSAVKYKTLNIDIKFDPYSSKDLAMLQSLFQDDVSDSVKYICPLKVRVRGPEADKSSAQPKYPVKNTGIFFREPLALELEVSGREKEFREAVRAEMGKAAFLADVSKSQAKKSGAVADSYADTFRKADDKAKLAETKAPSGTDADKQAAKDLRKIANGLKQASDTHGKTFNADKKEADDNQSRSDALKKQYETVLGTTEHQKTTFPIQAMNKSRVFAFNVARSAFVQNKKQNLTIVDGTLRGIYKLKPSEAEGFSEIPLKLTEKILALPKDLLTFRKQVTDGKTDSIKSQTNGVNAQADLISAQQTLQQKQAAAAAAQNSSP